jgi:pyruvate-formate lyase-activating enzyme
MARLSAELEAGEAQPPPRTSRTARSPIDGPDFPGASPKRFRLRDEVCHDRVTPVSTTPSAARATLQVFTDCDNACVFCAQAGLAQTPASSDDLRARLQALRATHDEVTLTGGEPTLHPELPALVRAARAIGFTRVGVQTHGRRLRENALTRALVEAGLTDAHFSLHGGTPAVHDHHTGVAGSFLESVAGAGSARGAGVTVVVTTVLTRSNFRSLGEMPAWLVSRGFAAWRLLLPVSAGRATEAFDRVLPRLAMALPSALHALESARKTGLSAWIQGAPLCLLGPYASRALGDEPRAYGEACRGCAVKDVCPGVDAHYLRRFHGDELAASRAPKVNGATNGLARESALARMFTDIGPRATEGLSPRARVALPVVRESSGG